MLRKSYELLKLMHYTRLKNIKYFFFLSPQPLEYKATDTLVVMVMDGCEFIRLSELNTQEMFGLGA